MQLQSINRVTSHSITWFWPGRVAMAKSVVPSLLSVQQAGLLFPLVYATGPPAHPGGNDANWAIR
jgi:hypothetical protein